MGEMIWQDNLVDNDNWQREVVDEENAEPNSLATVLYSAKGWCQGKFGFLYLTVKIGFFALTLGWRTPFIGTSFAFPVWIRLISEKSTSMKIRWRCCSKRFLWISSSTFWKRLYFLKVIVSFYKKYTLFLILKCLIVWRNEWVLIWLFSLLRCR